MLPLPILLSLSLSILFLSFLFSISLSMPISFFAIFFSQICIYHYFPEEAEMYSCTLYVNQQEI